MLRRSIPLDSYGAMRRIDNTHVIALSSSQVMTIYTQGGAHAHLHSSTAERQMIAPLQYCIFKIQKVTYPSKRDFATLLLSRKVPAGLHIPRRAIELSKETSHVGVSGSSIEGGGEAGINRSEGRWEANGRAE